MNYLEDAYHSAREALQDMVSHESSFANAFGGLIKDTDGDSELDATEFDREARADNISYYQKEHSVVRRMAAQARHALRVMPPTLKGFITIDAIAEAASNFARQSIAKNVVLACLHAPIDPPKLSPESIVTFEFEGEQVEIDPLIVRFVQSFISLLPRPLDTKLTYVGLHTEDGVVETHISSLTKGQKFTWPQAPFKTYECLADPVIVYSGDEPIWSVKCDPVEVSNG